MGLMKTYSDELDRDDARIILRRRVQAVLVHLARVQESGRRTGVNSLAEDNRGGHVLVLRVVVERVGQTVEAVLVKTGLRSLQAHRGLGQTGGKTIDGLLLGLLGALGSEETLVVNDEGRRSDEVKLDRVFITLANLLAGEDITSLGDVRRGRKADLGTLNGGNAETVVRSREDGSRTGVVADALNNISTNLVGDKDTVGIVKLVLSSGLLLVDISDLGEPGLGYCQ